jgi:hypothetical protein
MKEFDRLPDSGERQEFQNGAVRDTAKGKPRPDLISPFFMERLGKHLGLGAEKYDPWNWAKGIPNSRCFASLMRHLTQFAQGDESEDHLAAAACNIMFMIHNEEVESKRVRMNMKTGVLSDMPIFEKEEKDVQQEN